MSHFISLDLVGMTISLCGITAALLLLRFKRALAGFAVLVFSASIQTGIQFWENWSAHGFGDLRTDASGVVLAWSIVAAFLVVIIAFRENA